MNLRAGVRDTNSGAFSPRAIFGFWPVLARVTLLNRRSRVQKIAAKASATINRPDFRRFEQQIRYLNHGSGPAANYVSRHA
jgi:hypothetical protein